MTTDRFVSPYPPPEGLERELRVCAAEECAVQHITKAPPLAGLGERYPVLTFTYRNHRGEVGERRVILIELRWGTSEWYPTPQWLLRGLDLDKGEEREFAVANIVPPAAAHGWQPPGAAPVFIAAADLAEVSLRGAVEALAVIDKLKASLEQIRDFSEDCGTQPTDDAMREIARQALEQTPDTKG